MHPQSFYISFTQEKETPMAHITDKNSEICLRDAIFMQTTAGRKKMVLGIAIQTRAIAKVTVVINKRLFKGRR